MVQVILVWCPYRSTHNDHFHSIYSWTSLLRSYVQCELCIKDTSHIQLLESFLKTLLICSVTSLLRTVRDLNLCPGGRGFSKFRDCYTRFIDDVVMDVVYVAQYGLPFRETG